MLADYSYFKDSQQAPEIATCFNCGSTMFKGQAVVEHEGDYYCDTKCLGEKLVEVEVYTEKTL